MFDRQNGGQRGEKFREKSGFLTSEELQYWNENFCLDHGTEGDVPVVKRRRETWNWNEAQVSEMVIPF
jgi:hypothetical protein